MLVLSHRGYHVSAPENTLESFSQAVAMKVDGIETDLRVARDGEILLFHDRLAPDGQEVVALTRAELSEQVGYSVPNADDAVAAHDRLFWNLEIKTPDAVDGALAIVKKHRASRRLFLLTSFWHSAIDELAWKIDDDAALRGAEDVRLGLLTADRPLNLFSFLGISETNSKPPVHAIVWYYDVVDPKLLEEAKQLGLANCVYGVKTVADHRQCLDWKLDAVITDRPEFVAEARRNI
ncbi:MAG: glycerophosphodiester phosphodiesterase [Pirellulales bacterium]|nr:glycerophosphodiester phosphodiesterase [Pirellulales bacterium]